MFIRVLFGEARLAGGAPRSPEKPVASEATGAKNNNVLLLIKQLSWLTSIVVSRILHRSWMIGEMQCVCRQPLLLAWKR
jgi:hypothetical protein